MKEAIQVMASVENDSNNEVVNSLSDSAFKAALAAWAKSGISRREQLHKLLVGAVCHYCKPKSNWDYSRIQAILKVMKEDSEFSTKNFGKVLTYLEVTCGITVTTVGNNHQIKRIKGDSKYTFDREHIAAVRDTANAYWTIQDANKPTPKAKEVESITKSAGQAIALLQLTGGFDAESIDDLLARIKSTYLGALNDDKVKEKAGKILKANAEPVTIEE